MAVIDHSIGFRGEGGQVDFYKVLDAPMKTRIPAMLAYSKTDTYKIVSNTIKMFLATEGVADALAIHIANSIITTAAEDQIGMQDIVIFLQDMIAGKYDKFYGSISVISFMEKFEQYRVERIKAFHAIQDEKHAQQKGENWESRIPEPEKGSQFISTEKLNDQINTLKSQYGEF